MELLYVFPLTLQWDMRTVWWTQLQEKSLLRLRSGSGSADQEVLLTWAQLGTKLHLLTHPATAAVAGCVDTLLQVLQSIKFRPHRDRCSPRDRVTASQHLGRSNASESHGPTWSRTIASCWLDYMVLSATTADIVNIGKLLPLKRIFLTTKLLIKISKLNIIEK